MHSKYHDIHSNQYIKKMADIFVGLLFITYIITMVYFNLINSNLFKSCLADFLIGKTYYSVQEFSNKRGPI